jgi:hypothetical protein
MQHCLCKGLPFRLVVLEDNLQALRPQGLLPNYNHSSWLDNADAPIPQDRCKAANSRILQEYLRGVTAVLQRPHTHRFLTAGDNADTPIPQDRHEAANSRILQEYLRGVTVVLQRPHAHRFLSLLDSW